MTPEGRVELLLRDLIAQYADLLSYTPSEDFTDLRLGMGTGFLSRVRGRNSFLLATSAA